VVKNAIVKLKGWNYKFIKIRGQKCNYYIKNFKKWDKVMAYNLKY
jgi:hypothetical protein